MESAASSAHVILGEEREAEVARTLANAGHPVILVSSLAVTESDRLRLVRLPLVRDAQRAVLEAVVLQALAGALADAAGIAIDEFVFHAADTKVGGVPLA